MPEHYIEYLVGAICSALGGTFATPLIQSGLAIEYKLLAHWVFGLLGAGALYASWWYFKSKMKTRRVIFNVSMGFIFGFILLLLAVPDLIFSTALSLI